jgi:hypothetical protein
VDFFGIPGFESLGPATKIDTKTTESKVRAEMKKFLGTKRVKINHVQAYWASAETIEVFQNLTRAFSGASNFMISG